MVPAQALLAATVQVGTCKITIPSAGAAANTTSMFGESVAAQILVLGAGPVNITNLAVDGTGGDMNCAGNIWVAGTFYGSGSSGAVNRCDPPTRSIEPVAWESGPRMPTPRMNR